ncbi:hypothetical protein SAMN05443287_11721 [Micromonospora phaseoli]|uniref:Uncharacterized protein n=1 Tax=Micromonospora phaseoli TaxID=1144548 RepID=A0A1H7DV64_9ACTN|nr:hypothetical protein [Micromonospora phaseoli]PZV99172.1 hypothetical protein CLV64_104409 [Micromonospora phaseoli]GIJ80031.1 hypothetical protein Xph01_44630 [Micromonospora phaseoli]SEK04707.1 hypothetical protein SAMN05443287_11721 [Micromonospora phaseoli]
MSRHRVLLIRPWPAARVGSGCCAGATDICGEGRHEDPALARQRTEQRPLGEVYLTVRAGLPPDVAVEIVDPHNTLFLLPAVVWDGRRHRRPWRVLLRDLVRAPGYAAIIVDGRVVSDAGLPAPEQALRLIRQALAAPRSSR